MGRVQVIVREDIEVEVGVIEYSAPFAVAVAVVGAEAVAVVVVGVVVVVVVVAAAAVPVEGPVEPSNPCTDTDSWLGEGEGRAARLAEEVVDIPLEDVMEKECPYAHYPIGDYLGHV